MKARGKGWIRFMRIVAWVIFAVLILAGVLGGIGVMSLGKLTASQNAGLINQMLSTYGIDAPADGVAGAISSATGSAMTAVGIVFITVCVVLAFIELGAMMVYLDMAENVRRITLKISRRGEYYGD